MNVYLILANRESLQREAMRLGKILSALGRSSGPERVGKLVDREDALAAMAPPLLLAHARQQAEVVLLHRLLAAADLEFALGAVAVQDEVGWRRVGQQHGDFFKAFPHLADEGRGLHLQRGVAVAVDDFAEAHFVPEQI